MTFNVSVGEQMPPLTKHIAITDMVAYAGATWDWHKLHYDPAYLAEKKLPAPVVDGQVFGAYLAQAIQDWLGLEAFITELSFQFASMVFAGQTVRCEGSVSAATAESIKLDLRVVVIDESGNEKSVAVAPASAAVVKR